MAIMNQIGDCLEKEKQPFSLDSTDSVLPSRSNHEGRRSATTHFKSTHVFETRLEETTNKHLQMKNNEYLRTKTELCIGLVFNLMQIKTLTRIQFDKAATLLGKLILYWLLPFTIYKHCLQLPTWCKISPINTSFDEQTRNIVRNRFGSELRSPARFADYV